MPINTVSGESSGFGNIIVKVVKGEMASEKVDVIVNTTSKSLDLTNGAVSQSLLKKGGQTLQNECEKKYPNGIQDGDIAVTSGGNLTCKMVCHGSLMQWSDETTSKKMLHGLMKKCLDQCKKDGFTSIAFPALGTGNLGYPKDIVAREMFQHISTYSRDNPSSSVIEVRFVVYQNDESTIKAFESEQQKWSSSGTSRHVHPKESSAYSSQSAPCTSKAAETENFSRISCLLVDIGTKVLRRLLHFYAITPTCNLPQFIKNNEKDIRDLGKKKVLTRPQLEEIFPISGTTDLKTYDITLISALLLNLKSIKLVPQVEKAVKDVRNDRNLYQAHASSARMNSSDFSTHWTRISQSLIYLCRCCDDSDFKDDISEEIERIKQSGLQALQTRINNC